MFLKAFFKNYIILVECNIRIDINYFARTDLSVNENDSMPRIKRI